MSIRGPLTSSTGRWGGPRIRADFDGDGFPDYLEFRGKGCTFERGGKDGPAPAEPSALIVAEGPVRWCLGDFDADGRLDIFVSDSKRCALWENSGSGKFRDVTALAGSLATQLPAGAADVLATDLNHDGRTDIAVLSKTGEFSYHFNRGFRCFACQGGTEARFRGSPPGAHDRRGFQTRTARSIWLSDTIRAR